MIRLTGQPEESSFLQAFDTGFHLGRMLHKIHEREKARVHETGNFSRFANKAGKLIAGGNRSLLCVSIIWLTQAPMAVENWRAFRSAVHG